MIYEFPDADAPIRQGDIFFPIPNLTIDLDNLLLLNNTDNSIEVTSWEDIGDVPCSVALPIAKCWGIVASQDCDTERATTISLFVIRPFTATSGNPAEFANRTPKWWMEKLTTKSKNESLKWFYLPPDDRIGFSERMIAVFQDVVQVPRAAIYNRRNYLRKGRLNEVADEHFRESIAQFFRRYPYNEWYPLNIEEFNAYNSDKGGDIEPYPWQGE